MRKPTFVLLLIPAFAIACSSDDDASLGSGGSAGFGASTGSGGFVTTGGSTSTGGSGGVATGGASSGGASGASGASGAGGASGASGASGAGGAATGGTGGAATGGTGGAATGGTGGAATGGTGGTGGAATGGTGGAATGGTGGSATGGTGGAATGGTGGSATGGTGGAATGGTGGAGGSGGCSTNAHIVINELVPNPPSSDNGKEWLELYNPTCSAVSIAGWVIESATSTFAPTFTLPNGASIPSLGYVVIGGADVTFADFKKTTALNMGNASGSADAVRLVNAQSAVIDTVIYGSPNSDAFKDDTGAVATSLAPTPTSSQALARIPNGSDTNQCGADFIATHNLTPKAVNAP